MAIHIQTGKNVIQTVKREAKIQLLPCKIHADCQAPVSRYFNTVVKSNNDEYLDGTFRGYPLKGSKIELPEGYTGVVLHENLRPETEECDRKFYVIHEFQSVVNWNWDKIPSKNDALTRALEWISIAEALHLPIED